MNCLSINIQGAGNVEKRGWIRKLCTKHKINFLAVQETKTNTVDLFTLRSIWGNLDFSYACSPARGQSGGIWVIWNPALIQKTRVVVHDWYIVLEAIWVLTGQSVSFISVYAPQPLEAKCRLWGA